MASGIGNLPNASRIEPVNPFSFTIMKIVTRFMLLALLSLSGLNTFAQDSEINTEGALVVDLAGGTGGMLGTMLGITSVTINNPNYSTATANIDIAQGSTGISPILLRIDYRVLKWLSFGAEGIYSSRNLTYNTVGPLKDGSTTDLGTMTAKMVRPGGGLRIALHMGGDHPFIDPYFTGTLGFRFNMPVSMSSPTLMTEGFTTTKSPWVRGAFGVRAMSPAGIGGHVEIGFGGPFLSAGLSVRIPTN